MKLYKSMLAIASLGIMMMTSCKDANFLEEKPTDVLLTSNALLNKAQFDVMSASIYRNIQLFYNSADGTKDAWILGLGTDVCFDPRDASTKFNNWAIVTSQDAYSNDFFNAQYNIIKIANTLIEGAANPAVTWSSEAIKNATIAEARFFRGFAYRNLANIYGGVPIVDKPVKEAKDDFVRNTREECWAFAKADLEFARTYLPLTTTSPGRVVRAAADHFLSEVNISLKDYDGAIAAATRVIDGTDGNYSLVKARFGARANEADKNYYYDLFVIGNQNTQAGNNEGLMVAQFEVTSSGGPIPGGVPGTLTRPLIERTMWCNYWGLAKIGYTSGVAVDSTGRGVGFVRPTNYTNYTIWRNAGSDIRNSETCIKRKYYFGPGIAASTGFKPKDLIPKSFLTTRDDTMIYVFPNWSKFGTDKHINGQPDNGYVRDFYVARLSETYLLRAEANLKKGLTTNAANDINVVRGRAQAPLITATDVTMDYILDERARELYGEEFRISTLARLGLVYDRTKRFGTPESAASIQPFNNLLPIPQTAIDRNIGARINQNPGY
jgi:hypothetical protein